MTARNVNRGGTSSSSVTAQVYRSKSYAPPHGFPVALVITIVVWRRRAPCPAAFVILILQKPGRKLRTREDGSGDDESSQSSSCQRVSTRSRAPSESYRSRDFRI